ncbi:ABC transporter permease [Patulibacter minatonensis]|uniref:ABC transporter permease n=1 Tax=Patulibacter minatonensis TaxID=298163 RepID=UPI0004795C0C|nr:ABC transporter permease [Patulibacter minatonensis]
MSTATAPATAVRGLRGSAPSAPALARVELRKMVDTRAGRWLLIAAALIAVAAALARMLTGDVQDRTFLDAFQITLLPFGVLLPVIGILAATGEWSQRTALSTFALVPRRDRVIAAKGLAVLVLGLAGLVIAVLAAGAATAVGSLTADLPDPWTTSGGAFAQAVLFQELSVLWGLGFGLVLFAPAVAIVAFFVLPTIFTLLGQLASGLEDPLRWVDPNLALSPLADGNASGTEWARVATASALWIAIPIAVGVWRTMRREVK